MSRSGQLAAPEPTSGPIAELQPPSSPWRMPRYPSADQTAAADGNGMWTDRAPGSNRTSRADRSARSDHRHRPGGPPTGSYRIVRADHSAQQRPEHRQRPSGPPTGSYRIVRADHSAGPRSGTVDDLGSQAAGNRAAGGRGLASDIPLELDLDFDGPGSRRRGPGTRRAGRARHVASAGQPSSGADDADRSATSSKNEVVVPLRPVRTDEGYRSVYSEMTRRTVGSVMRSISRGAGELLITCGLIVLLLAAYEIWGVTAKVEAHQDQLGAELDREWAKPTPSTTASPTPAGPPAEGVAFAKLYIPRMEKPKPWNIVEGTSTSDIQYAPGHYIGTAMPGEVGNFSLAGHRTLAIFWDLDRIQNGDVIVVETSDAWYIYAATSRRIVTPTAVDVVAPVPDHPGQAPTKASVTLTTCNPKGQNYQRLVIHGELVRKQAHDGSQPQELAAG